MPTTQEIASRKAWISAQLTAGGTNVQIKEWYYEYKELEKALKAAKATDNNTEDHGQGNPESGHSSSSPQSSCSRSVRFIDTMATPTDPEVLVKVKTPVGTEPATDRLPMSTMQSPTEKKTCKPPSQDALPATPAATPADGAATAAGAQATAPGLEQDHDSELLPVGALTVVHDPTDREKVRIPFSEKLPRNAADIARRLEAHKMASME